MRFLLPTLLAALALLPAASAQAAPHFGFNDHSSVSGEYPFDTSASLAARAGATSSRLTIDWSWVEYEDDQFAWGMPDGVYKASLAKGIRLLIGVTGAPRWAWPEGATCAEVHCNYPPARAFDADYKEFVAALARRYPQAVGIEIGNEPNLDWAWVGGLDPARYTELLKLGYAAVKSVDPNMPVIGASLAPVLDDRVTASVIGQRPFLQAMYDNGAKGHMDAIGVHPYPFDLDFAMSFAAIAQAKEVRTVNGDDVPLWVTELGMTTTGGFSEYDQGITMPNLIAALRMDPEIGGIYVHSLVENDNSPVPEEPGHGMLRPNLDPKPAYCGIATLNRVTWKCPKSVPKATPTTDQLRHWDAQVLLQAAADAARKVHVAEGSYAQVTAADLNAADPRISPLGVSSDQTPGTAADPARVGVYPWTDGNDAILLCNSSKGTRSYCIWTFWRSHLIYGSEQGTLYQAAGATTHGVSATW